MIGLVIVIWANSFSSCWKSEFRYSSAVSGEDSYGICHSAQRPKGSLEIKLVRKVRADLAGYTSQKYRVIQEESALLWEMIVCVILSKKSSYEHGSDFERLRSYDRLKLGIEGNDY